MIRKSLATTKAATFCVFLPHVGPWLPPTPYGTGFFVSPDGWFVTAAHVLTQNGDPTGPLRDKLYMMMLMQSHSSELMAGIKVVHVEPDHDFALLKADIEGVLTGPHISASGVFPYVEVSSRTVEEGEPVYSCGYPLSDIINRTQEWPSPEIGFRLHHRTTSAIVSSHVYSTIPPAEGSSPTKYVIDKALNYGNSGGPIIATETGKVFALCSRFHPAFIPQSHLGPGVGPIMIPSLYGIVSSLSAAPVLDALRRNGVPISVE